MPARPSAQPETAAMSAHDRVKRPKRVRLPGGKAYLGTHRPELPGDGEAPLRLKAIKAFDIMATTVTNAEFAAFVDATGYITEAERFGWSFVFYQNVPNYETNVQAVVGAEWWRVIDGANWRDIHGPETEEPAFRADHPVVHVSWGDAMAYCQWVGGRLPSEVEWEYAARGGINRDVRFPWGDEEPGETDFLPCNIWQGRFPSQNTAADGYYGTAPAQSFAPNGYGLYNMVGNVWEWTADPFKIKSLRKEIRQRLSAQKGHKLLKGGSFLCHKSYCYRYRIAARIGNAPDSTTPHQGFRVVWDI